MGNGELADVDAEVELLYSTPVNSSSCGVCANALCVVWGEYPGDGSTRKN